MRNYLDGKPSKDYCDTPVTAPVLPKNKTMIVWINITVQLLLPLSLSFTPTIASAQRAQDSVFSTPTERYTLGVNEAIDTVEKNSS
ncbi:MULTISPECIES: hypothetical protein [Symbiopectobacterium]|uniref:hypothetical protein n=1 Tax=Symbiopectobacterium TaxID=801 RepID=UPI00207A7CF8|nr:MULTISPECIES: hypothetical protein [Symbiopectobacterium]